MTPEEFSDLKLNHQYWIAGGKKGEDDQMIIKHDDMRGIDMVMANLMCAIFEDVNFTFVKMTGTNFERCQFKNCTFDHANMGSSNFDRAVFIGCTFKSARGLFADFSMANFTGCDFYRADFSGCKFTSAGFYEVTAYETVFDGANMQAATWRDVDLRGAKIEGTCINLDAKMERVQVSPEFLRFLAARLLSLSCDDPEFDKLGQPLLEYARLSPWARPFGLMPGGYPNADE